MFFVDALQLFFNPIDLLSRRGALLVIQLRCPGAGQPPMDAVHHRHLQIANQFRRWSGRDFLLPLRFKKQRRILQNAFADRGRSPAPGRVQLASFACIAVMLGENGGYPLAVLDVLPRHRNQEQLHRHLRRNLALAHLLLDGLRQKFYQRQPPRHPRHAAIEPPRQLLQAVTETLLQLL